MSRLLTSVLVVTAFAPATVTFDTNEQLVGAVANATPPPCESKQYE